MRKSPYVHNITRKTISYTLEFKELFWQRYLAGEMPDKIFRECGIDPDVLDDSRVWGLVTTLRRLAAKGLPFDEGRAPHLKEKPLTCHGKQPLNSSNQMPALQVLHSVT